MEKYSKKAESFINNYVLSKLGYDSISDDNIVEIVDYIIDNYEVPLAFLARDTDKLRIYIKGYIKKKDDCDLLMKIENGKLKALGLTG